MALMSSAGKTVVVTGGARGIGRYVAGTFAKAGANVVIADIAPTDTVLSELRALGADPLALMADITDEAAVRHLFDAAYDKFGRVDTLLNNAAVVTNFYAGAPRWPKIRDMAADHFTSVITTNLIGTFLCAKAAIPYMEALGAGHIINFGQGALVPEVAPYNKYAGTCAYTVSKVAVRAFTRDLADEEREFNICVISMGPSFSGYPGGGIITEDMPGWLDDPRRHVRNLGDNYLIAADAPMEVSGKQVAVRDGVLVALGSDEMI
jgi:3-oxoacyl-[acyl-carrier protein] reductase